MNKLLALLIAACFAAGAIAAGPSAPAKSTAADAAKIKDKQAAGASTAASAQHMQKEGQRRETVSGRAKRRLSSAAQSL
jgi:hypothetical protein